MNERKTELVQINSELAISRRLYGLIEKLADSVGARSVDRFLRDELEASIIGVRESRHIDRMQAACDTIAPAAPALPPYGATA